jgi:hypothetical protein
VGSWYDGYGYHADGIIRCTAPEQARFPSYMTCRDSWTAHAGAENGLVGCMDHLLAVWHGSHGKVAVVQKRTAEPVSPLGQRCCYLRCRRCSLSSVAGGRSCVCLCEGRVANPEAWRKASDNRLDWIAREVYGHVLLCRGAQDNGHVDCDTLAWARICPAEDHGTDLRTIVCLAAL